MLCVTGSDAFPQMEKQVLEQTLQQVLEQPLSKSGSPTTSQQDSAAGREKNKSPSMNQVHPRPIRSPAIFVKLECLSDSLEVCAVSGTSPMSRR